MGCQSHAEAQRSRVRREMFWRCVRHRAVTESTNRDARAGAPGDVFTADLQTAGRGRLDHHWLSPPGENLLMSAVVGVEGVPPEEVATLPLVAGLAVANMAVEFFTRQGKAATAAVVRLKWPNDVLVDGRKLCGILCERVEDRVIVGLGLNVRQVRFAPEIEGRATSLLRELGEDLDVRVSDVRDSILDHLGAALSQWRGGGFRSVWPAVCRLDFLKGRELSVARVENDSAPVKGVCEGIGPDGALLVAGVSVYAGEAHVVVRGDVRQNA